MKTAASEQKLRGGYYTPPTIAQFLTDWAIQTLDDAVLEPSAGDGVFVDAAVRRLTALGGNTSRVTAVEIDRDEAAKVRSRLGDSGGSVHPGDFFAWARSAKARGEQFDAILGNPPFLRFAYFQPEHRDIAFKLMQDQGLKPNKLTNAWLPFVAIATSLLTPRGRLAMVVPAELLQVSYAAQLRQYLSDNFHRVTVYAFDRLVFGGIQQEVVLLTAECAGDGPGGIRVIEVEDVEALNSGHHDWSAEPLKAMDHNTEKWTQYFLSTDQLELVRHLRSSGKLIRLGDVAEVDVGVVTGMNDFFVVDANGATPVELKAHSIPILTRSKQLLGAEVTEEDWRTFYDAGQARLLLALDDSAVIDGVLEEYIALGEERKVDKGYKCSIRRKWYVVPSRWRPGGFMLRQVHTFPRLALNRTPATSTDTVHRVAFKDEATAEALVAAFHNSATFLFAEIFGRSYGGGILELEPTEAENLLVPSLQAAPSLKKVDAALRKGDVDALVRLGDQALTATVELSPDDLRGLFDGWTRLRDRRLRRNRASRLTAVEIPRG